MDDKPQIVLHIEKSLSYNIFDVKWVPRSARLAVMGSNASVSGNLQVFELAGNELKEISNTKFTNSLKCGTFRASDISSRQLAVGDFHGLLQIVDLSRPEKPIYKVQAHAEIVNTIDGVGGIGVGEGAAELVTGGSDSIVNVWDPRQPEHPVVRILPQAGSHKPDCWAVAAGNAYSASDRAIAAGFDNGDIKIFDLRTSKVLWGTNIQNGVCALEFDRRDILMNKLVATSLEAKLHVFDVRTLDSQNKFASISVSAHNSTVWCVRHLPQDRDVWMTTGGNGTLNLWQYHYPELRTRQTAAGKLETMPGEVQCLQQLTASAQPITSFDWNADKKGLAAFTAIDQMLRIAIVTKLNTL